MDLSKPCRRCLLSEMDESSYKSVVEKGLSGLLSEDRAEEKLYKDRLQMCRSCDNLMSGTCLSCGCYVEIRAAINKGRCPEKKW